MSRRNRAKRAQRELLGPMASPLLIFISCALEGYEWIERLLEALALNIRPVWGWWYELGASA